MQARKIRWRARQPKFFNRYRYGDSLHDFGFLGERRPDLLQGLKFISRLFRDYFEIISDYFRLFQIISDYFSLFQIISDYFRLFRSKSVYFGVIQFSANAGRRHRRVATSPVRRRRQQKQITKDNDDLVLVLVVTCHIYTCNPNQTMRFCNHAK
jgi:hypothetical protein